VLVSGAVDRVLDRLEQVKKNGSGWLACCPAHDDRTASLSVKEGDDGRVLLFCHAGCSVEQIVGELGLGVHDLFPEKRNGSPAESEAIYDYVDERGRVLFQAVRFPGKRFRQRRPDPNRPGAYVWNLDGVRRVPYRLDRLHGHPGLEEQTVYICEGEKDVHAVEAVGGLATCNPMGAGKWDDSFAEHLRGFDRIVVIADRDRPGRQHAAQVGASLTKIGLRVELVQAAVGKDAHDHLTGGHGLDEFLPLADEPSAHRDDVDLTDLTVDKILAANPGLSKDELLSENPRLRALLGGKSSHASEVARLVRESGALLFHDAEARAYVTFEHEGHRETWPLRSRRAKLYARLLYHREKNAAPNAQAINDGLANLESTAIFDGSELPVYLRLAGDAGTIHLDLGDAAWRGVTITKTGWTVVDEHPVRFRRARGIAELPQPVSGGRLDDLRRFLNVSSDDDWRLIIAWLLAACRPPGQPYPVLVLHGEQGSAKSTTAKVLRGLIDPSVVPLRAAPRELRDLMISANSSWIVSFDNLSHLQPWLSDGICRLATGGGFTTRELYTDEDEIILEAQRPVILNGIEELATRSDLLDRAVLVNLPTIPTSQRRSENSFWSDFYVARPAILGALYEALAGALAKIDSTELERLPRMADFALWATAAEATLGWQAGSFMRSYQGNRTQAHELAVDATPIGTVLVEVATEGFEGTATELLALLANRVDEKVTKQPEWPRSPQALSGIVKRLAPNLRALGFEIDHYREPHARRRRLLRLRKADA
jgi:hypothetical protein